MRNKRSNGKYNFLAVSTLFFLVCGAPLGALELFYSVSHQQKLGSRWQMNPGSWKIVEIEQIE